jgi:hypothetical protein
MQQLHELHLPPRKRRKRRRARKRGRTKGTYRKVSTGYARHLLAPQDFSFVHNPDRTAEFFRRLESYLIRRQAAFVDLEQVGRLSHDAIMYLLALVDVYSQTGPVKIHGNRPGAPGPRETFIASGFYELLSGRTTVVDRSQAHLAIRSGHLAEGDVVGEVVDFVDSCIGPLPAEKRRAIFRVLIECMGNTRNHAYEQGTHYLPKWWLAGAYDVQRACVQLMALDYGQGIPSTVRTKFAERIGRLFRSSRVSDEKLVLSALRGEFRTRTRQSFRGKGLPAIRQSADACFISELAIVSDSAFVAYSRGDIRSLEIPVRGTLVSFSVQRPGPSKDGTSNGQS